MAAAAAVGESGAAMPLPAAPARQQLLEPCGGAAAPEPLAFSKLLRLLAEAHERELQELRRPAAAAGACGEAAPRGRCLCDGEMLAQQRSVRGEGPPRSPRADAAPPATAARAGAILDGAIDLNDLQAVTLAVTVGGATARDDDDGGGCNGTSSAGTSTPRADAGAGAGVKVVGVPADNLRRSMSRSDDGSAASRRTRNDDEESGEPQRSQSMVSRESGSQLKRPNKSSKIRLRSELNLDIENYGRRMRLGLRSLLWNSYMETAFALLILANAIVMGCEAQYDGMNLAAEINFPGTTRSGREAFPTAERIFDVMQWVFGIVFCVELLLKLFALRLEFFFSAWNLFDVLVTAIWVIDRVVSMDNFLNPMLFRIIRLARLLRLMRLAKSLAVFDILQLIIISLKASAAVLMWSLVLLILIMFSAALVLTHFASGFIQDPLTPDNKKIEAFAYFGTISRSMLTMFELTFANWVPVTRFLQTNMSEMYGFFLICYYCVVSFAVVTVVRGIFLCETFRCSANDDELMIARAARQFNNHCERMQMLFDEADVGGDGYITYEEFIEVMHDPRVKTWLSSMDLSVDDPDTLFRLLDTAGDNRIWREELVKGVAMLKGPAKSVDLHTLIARMHLKLDGFESLAGLKSGEAAGTPTANLAAAVRGLGPRTCLSHQSTRSSRDEERTPSPSSRGRFSLSRSKG